MENRDASCMGSHPSEVLPRISKQIALTTSENDQFTFVVSAKIDTSLKGSYVSFSHYGPNRYLRYRGFPGYDCRTF